MSASAAKRRAIQRYRLYWAQLDPTQGSEIAKTRPVVVVSPDAMNQHLETVVVCPLTPIAPPMGESRWLPGRG